MLTGQTHIGLRGAGRTILPSIQHQRVVHKHAHAIIRHRAEAIHTGNGIDRTRPTGRKIIAADGAAGCARAPVKCKAARVAPQHRVATEGGVVKVFAQPQIRCGSLLRTGCGLCHTWRSHAHRDKRHCEQTNHVATHKFQKSFFHIFNSPLSRGECVVLCGQKSSQGRAQRLDQPRT